MAGEGQSESLVITTLRGSEYLIMFTMTWRRVAAAKIPPVGRDFIDRMGIGSLPVAQQRW
jgi:hypothetical protein